MANQTISWKAQTLNLFGPSPANQWGVGTWRTAVWGTDTWGAKSAGAGGVTPLISSVFKFWSKNNSIAATCPASAIFKGSTKSWTKPNSYSFVYSNLSKIKGDGGLYDYEFVDNTTNAESIPVNPFTLSVFATPAYALTANSTPTWVKT